MQFLRKVFLLLPGAVREDGSLFFLPFLRG